MKVLLIQQKMIGDVLVSSLLCEHLKTHLPGLQVHYLVNENTTAVVQNNPFIDRFLLFRKDYKKNRRQFYEFLKSISRERYDAVIDVYGKLESNLATLFSGASIRVAYYKPYSACLYTHTVKLVPKMAGNGSSTIQDRLSLLAPLVKGPLDDTKQPVIYLTEKEIAEARIFMQNKGVSVTGPVIMLSILGSSPAKTYPLPYMVSVIEILAEHTPATFLFNYIPEQEADARELLCLCRPGTQKRIATEAFAGDLRKFLGLLKHCDCIIGNEGGSANMAKALGIPTFSIFAPWTDKKGWHTFPDEKNIAVHLEDYFPEAVSNKSSRQIRKQSPALYQQLTPASFERELLAFVRTVL